MPSIFVSRVLLCSGSEQMREPTTQDAGINYSAASVNNSYGYLIRAGCGTCSRHFRFATRTPSSIFVSILVVNVVKPIYGRPHVLRRAGNGHLRIKGRGCRLVGKLGKSREHFRRPTWRLKPSRATKSCPTDKFCTVLAGVFRSVTNSGWTSNARETPCFSHEYPPARTPPGKIFSAGG